MFRHPAYFLEVTGSSIVLSGPNEEFFNSDFDLWVGVNHFSDGCCRPIRMHKLWRALGLSQLRVEQLSSLWKELAMRREIVVPGKHGILALMLALKEA